jgi:hypothetical protein
MWLAIRELSIPSQQLTSEFWQLTKDLFGDMAEGEMSDIMQDSREPQFRQSLLRDDLRVSFAQTPPEPTSENASAE